MSKYMNGLKHISNFCLLIFLFNLYDVLSHQFQISAFQKLIIKSTFFEFLGECLCHFTNKTQETNENERKNETTPTKSDLNLYLSMNKFLVF